MKRWPPKPGSTVITVTRSTASITGATALAGVPGLMATPAFLAEAAHRLQRPVQMRPGFGGNAYQVGAGGGERGEEGIDRRQHEMDIERQRAVRAQRRHDAGADGQRRHEMAVHGVDVDGVGSRLRDGAHFGAEARKIGGEDRGGDANVHAELR